MGSWYWKQHTRRRSCGTTKEFVVFSEKRNETPGYNALVTVDATGRARAGAAFGSATLQSKEEHQTTGRVQAPCSTRVAGACEIYFYPGGYGGLSSVGEA